jgi:hypothetical protein
MAARYMKDVLAQTAAGIPAQASAFAAYGGLW